MHYQLKSCLVEITAENLSAERAQRNDIIICESSQVRLIFLFSDETASSRGSDFRLVTVSLFNVLNANE
jgi:hypothetical protein